MPSIAYLDTHHISRLARFPDEAESVAVRQMLQDGKVNLAMTWLHLQELSAPEFVSRAQVGAFLDTLRVVWGPTPDKLFDSEVQAAIQYAMTREATKLAPFSESFTEAFEAPLEADIPIAEMLEAMANHPTLRTHLADAAHHGARMDARFKKAAAIVRNPKEPIVAHIRELNSRTTPSGLQLPRVFSPDEVIDLAGGLSGFPALHVSHSLARTRLGDERFPSVANDVVDEWHACYAPYVAVTALDRRTAARFRMARLPDAQYVTHSLKDVPRLLANRLTVAAPDGRLR